LGIGLCLFLRRKIGFGSLGLGIKQKIGMWLGFEQKVGQEIGLGQNFELGNGIYNWDLPPQPLLFRELS